MELNLGDTWIDIKCPNCSYDFEVQLKEAKLQSHVICNNCKTNINLVDNDSSVHTGLNTIHQSLKDLTNIFKKFK